MTQQAKVLVLLEKNIDHRKSTNAAISTDSALKTLSIFLEHTYIWAFNNMSELNPAYSSKSSL